MTVDAERVAPLALLFEPPPADADERLAVLVRDTGSETPVAAAALRELAGELMLDDPGAALDLFTRTFELAPICAPYLGVHLFGEESFTRAKLLTGLAERYRELDFDPGRELPDHIAVVLRCGPRFTAEEWGELVEFCFTPALPAMRRDLERVQSPFRHGLRALQALFGLPTEAEEVARG